MNRIARIASTVLALPFFGAGQTALPAPAPIGVPARMVITAGHFYSHEARDLMAGELIVTQDFEPLTVTKVTPLYGTPLELFFLVDNSSSCEANSQFTELHRFIASQTENTAVGVAYIREGQLQIAQDPILDHETAAKALNTPTGNRPSNPFVALRQLIEGWKPDGSRHVAILISNGIDPTATKTLLDPAADAAIEAAQRAGVIVFAIYHPSADYLTTDPSNIYAGQVQLAHIASETGGEAYLVGFGPLPSLAPFLGDLWDHLGNQYLMEFLATPGENGPALQAIEVRSELTDVHIMAPAKALVPTPKADGRVPGSGQ